MLACFVLASPSLFAGEVVYVAQLTGVECEGCKKSVARCLAKIEGVEVIRIENNDDGTHKLTVRTDGSRPISPEQATEAIAEVEHYQIKTWKVAPTPQS